MLGVFWIFELISAYLGVTFKQEVICPYTFILDAPALCAVRLNEIQRTNDNFLVQGLLLFLFLVAKKPVYMGMKEKASGLFTGESKSTYKTNASNNDSFSVKTT